jgi:hypothetical protein
LFLFLSFLFFKQWDGSWNGISNILCFQEVEDLNKNSVVITQNNVL